MSLWIVTFLALLLATLTALIWHLRRPTWMGFADKTLWDWIEIMAIPVVVGFGSVMIGEAQAAIERDRSAESTVQDYIDRFSDLARSPDDPMSIAVGRAHLATVLRIVDGQRAGRVIAFLDQIKMLHAFAPETEGINLDRAELKDLSLAGLDLEGASLRSADLEGSTLEGADLEGADLRGADLKDVNLRGADLDQARLDGALLDRADLRGTDLRLALGLRQIQLTTACLDADTVLPEALAEMERPTSGCSKSSLPSETDDDDD